MALQWSYKTADEIPEALKTYYRQDGTNGYVLDAPDAVPRSELEGTRGNNLQLRKEIDETLRPSLKKYQDIGTPEELAHLRDIKDQLDESKLIRSNKLEEALEKRLEKVKEEHTREKTALETRNSALQVQLSTLMIDNATIEAATKLGARPTALHDIVNRMRGQFKVEDGKLVCYKPNGERDYGKSGEGATIAEKLEELKPNAPHLFEENKGMGGGASGGGGAGGGAGRGGEYKGPNPWKKPEPGERANLTLRMKLIKENPQLAKRLKEEAGVRV
jgi:hypothetical protein